MAWRRNSALEMEHKPDDFKPIAMSDLRARIGEAVDAVAARGERFVIERKGKPLACLVPVSEFQPDIPSSRIHSDIEQLERAEEKRWRICISDKQIVSFEFPEQIQGFDGTIKIVLPHKYPFAAPQVLASPVDDRAPGRWPDGSLSIYGAMSAWNPRRHGVLDALRLARRWIAHYRSWQESGKWPQSQLPSNGTVNARR